MKTVAVLTASTGSGHNSVARTLANSLRRATEGQVAVRVLDLPGGAELSPLGRSSDLYGPLIVRFPSLWGLIYGLSDNSTYWRLFRAWFWRCWGRAMAAVLRRQSVDVLLCVHPMWNQIAAEALRRTDHPARLVTVVTDLGRAHAAWAAPEVDRYAVATPEARSSLVARGVDGRRIDVVGLPLDGRFTEGGLAGRPTAGMRGTGCAAHARGPGRLRMTVLLTGGGEGAGGLGSVARAIGRAGLPVELLIVAGRNRRLRAELDRCGPACPHRLFGYVADMPALVRAVDLVVGKGGALTIGETVLSARPLAIVNPLPGQEVGNAEFVRRHGLGHVADGLSELVEGMRRWCACPDVMDGWVESGSGWRRDWAGAADRVADMVLETLECASATRRKEARSSGRW